MPLPVVITVCIVSVNPNICTSYSPNLFATCMPIPINLCMSRGHVSAHSFIGHFGRRGYLEGTNRTNRLTAIDRPTVAPEPDGLKWGMERKEGTLKNDQQEEKVEERRGEVGGAAVTSTSALEVRGRARNECKRSIAPLESRGRSCSWPPFV